MERQLLYLTIIVGVSVYGQFLETEFSVGSVPLYLRRGVAYEIQPSVGRILEARPDVNTRSIHQQIKQTDNQRNTGGFNRNENNLGTRTEQNEYRRNNDNNRKVVNNRGQAIDNQFRGQQQPQNQLNNMKLNRPADKTENNYQNNIEKQQTSNVDIGEGVKNLSTDENLQNPSSRPATEPINPNNSDYIIGNIRTSTARTEIMENSQSDFTVNQNSENNSGANNFQRRGQNSDSSANSVNLPEINTPENDQGSRKPAQNNELANKPTSDDKWVWSEGGVANTTVKTPLPTVDDRAAFGADKCPGAQVRFNNVCVDPD